MAFKDLRDFIDLLEQEGELKRIQTEVDPYLEVTEISIALYDVVVPHFYLRM